MLIKHTLRYLPAQLLSPLAQLASMVLWTHWLLPADMGLFTLVTVAQEFSYLACLGWFSVYALRYLPRPDQPEARLRYLHTENAVVLASAAGGLLSALLIAWTLPALPAQGYRVAIIWCYIVTRAFNAHYAERARAQSSFLTYTVLQMAGPVGGLALGWLAMRWWGASADILLAAYALAQAAGTLLALPGLSLVWRWPQPDRALLRDAAHFGLPWLGLAALGWVGENYIRYVVQWVSGAQAMGLMVVGWSLGRRGAAVASTLVTTAAFPLAARLLNEGRRDEALVQLRHNAALLIAVLAPVTVGVELLGPQLVALVVAPDYRDISASLLGLSMVAGVLRNLHMHVTDQLMVLERRTRMLAAVDLWEIALCTVATLIGLQWHGLIGAVIGQAFGSAVALALSGLWAHRELGFRWPAVEAAKVAVAGAVMAWLLSALNLRAEWWDLVLGSALGTMVYAVALASLSVPQLRRWRRAAVQQ